MSKIKEIQDRLIKNPTEYHKIRFVIAKQIFIFTVTLYFFCYLFTVWGFYISPFLSIDFLAKMTYHFYSLLVISTAFFGYSLVEFFVAMHFPEKKILLILTAVLVAIFAGGALIIHLGIF